MTHQLFRLIACMNSHFACDEQLPADCETWRQLRRHIVRMHSTLTLVHITLRDERKRGIPLTPETGRKLEGYARWGSGPIKYSQVTREGVNSTPTADPEKSSCKNVGSPREWLHLTPDE